MEIKPCQCGGVGDMKAIASNFFVKCDKCGNKTSWCESKTKAITAWDNRPREDELLTIIKRFVLQTDNASYGELSEVLGDAKRIIDKYEGVS